MLEVTTLLQSPPAHAFAGPTHHRKVRSSVGSAPDKMVECFQLHSKLGKGRSCDLLLTSDRYSDEQLAPLHGIRDKCFISSPSGMNETKMS
jgi:hypothetical protein